MRRQGKVLKKEASNNKIISSFGMIAYPNHGIYSPQQLFFKKTCKRILLNGSQCISFVPSLKNKKISVYDKDSFCVYLFGLEALVLATRVFFI